MGFVPAGPDQLAPLLAADRFCVISGGERAGKSTVLTKILTPHLIALPYQRPERFFNANGTRKQNPAKVKPRNPDFVLFAPVYGQATQEFEMIEADLRKLGKLYLPSLSKPATGKWRLVTTDGVVLETWSMADPEGIASIDLEGAGVCEAGACTYAAIERVRGRVAAKRGFIVYAGTIEKSEQWWKNWLTEGQRPNAKGIVSYKMPTWGNLHEFPGGQDDPEFKSWIAQFRDPEMAFERLAAEPRPPRERVMRELKEKHVVEMDWPDDAHHEIWVDPGYATAYAILWVAHWVNSEGKRVFYFYDEFYKQHLNTRQMAALCRQHPTWNKVNEGVIDIAAKGHRDATDSALEIWEAEATVQWHFNMWMVDRQIERIGASCLANQVWVNPKCRGLLAESGLGEPVFDGMHPWKYMVDKDGYIINENPIDRWNHSCKAMAYGLLHHLGQVDNKNPQTTRNRMRRDRVEETLPDKLFDSWVAKPVDNEDECSPLLQPSLPKNSSEQWSPPTEGLSRPSWRTRRYTMGRFRSTPPSPKDMMSPSPPPDEQ